MEIKENEKIDKHSEEQENFPKLNSVAGILPQ